jgi:glutamyl-tRNA synthetase/glutamyl-Q tRNA(Asp) synthetase
MNNREVDIRPVVARIDKPAVTRFAPSPTGYLHLGHVVNAIYVWGLAGAAGATVLLRIEDHDRGRSRPAFEAALLDDLDWLGFAATGGRDAMQRQSDHPGRYQAALERLRRSHHVYACDCSRKQIGGERYGGRCRDRNLPEAHGRGLRVAIGPGAELFSDVLLGPLQDTPQNQCGDVLLRDREGHWTYQFAATVDDMVDGVTLVIRGLDLVASTARQIRLGRMLGRGRAAQYAHHPLIVGADGLKLSKSRGDTGIRELRQSGVSPAEVLGRAAAAVALLPPGATLSAEDAAQLFL